MAKGLKTGGRVAGTSNRFTVNMKIWLEGLINQNRKALETDLKALEPYQRWVMMEKLISYILPKKQAVDIFTEKEAEYKALEKLIDSAPEQFIDEITDKILKLREAEYEHE